MSQQRVTTRSSSRLKAQELGGERGGEDEGSQNQGQGQDPVDAVLAPTTKDDFMATDDFRRLLRGYVDVVELFHTFRLVSKPWQRIAEEIIDRAFRSGILAFHDGSDVGIGRRGDNGYWGALEAKWEPVKQVIFPLNIMKVADHVCYMAVNLVVVDIPEGIKSIGKFAFGCCESLTTLSFSTTLTSIGDFAFGDCSSLDNVHLLHTNLQEIGEVAFQECYKLKSMTIPDSLQKLGGYVFLSCSELFPSNIDVSDDNEDNVTSEVVAHLRLQQLLAGKNFLKTDDFRRLIVPFLPNDALMTIKLASKPWSRVADEFIGDGVESGEMIVRGKEDLAWNVALVERRMLFTLVIFLLNITKVGECACQLAVNLVVVDIREGVESIGKDALAYCESLTTVSFPTTLKSIGEAAFNSCISLDNVDLLHTNLQELVTQAFIHCNELKSMTIPESLQTLGEDDFHKCFKLVPSHIDISNINNDVTANVVHHLRTQQRIAKLEKMLAERDAKIAKYSEPALDTTN